MTAEAWRRALARTFADAAVGDRLLRHAMVLDDVASTQDIARDAAHAAGTVVTALRQHAGRGRLGRSWLDTASAGLAVTVVLPDVAPEELAIRAAVAAADAARAHLPPEAASSCGIKWPNDVVLGGRKLAGVLCERCDGRSLVGIGINVAQAEFPPELAPHATSLAMLGGTRERLPVLLSLIDAVEAAFRREWDAVLESYRSLDRMTGRTCAFRTPSGHVEGRVQRVDPVRGIEVETRDGVQFLPAATTSVVPPPGPGRYGGVDVDA